KRSNLQCSNALCLHASSSQPGATPVSCNATVSNVNVGGTFVIPLGPANGKVVFAFDTLEASNSITLSYHGLPLYSHCVSTAELPLKDQPEYTPEAGFFCVTNIDSPQSKIC